MKPTLKLVCAQWTPDEDLVLTQDEIVEDVLNDSDVVDMVTNMVREQLDRDGPLVDPVEAYAQLFEAIKRAIQSQYDNKG